MELPFIDEHSRSIAASPEVTWEALVAVATGAFSSDATARIAKVLGCEQTEAVGAPGTQGSSFPGFRVARSDPPKELGLAGRHRFSSYLLTFRLHPEEEGRTLLRAETRATFPGMLGAAYRAAVIGTRGHVLVTTRILSAVARRAERGGAPRVPD